MKKLVKLLKKSRVGFFEGNYHSDQSYEELKDLIGKRINVIFSNKNGKFLGEYPLRIDQIARGNAFGLLLKENTSDPLIIDRKNKGVSITLIPLYGPNSDIGTFIAR